MELYLPKISDQALDEILCLSIEERVVYYGSLVAKYYPNVEDEEQYQDLIEYYSSSFYVEKLIRCNRFFSEKFTPIYTQTGLIRNIVLDLYFMEEELIAH